MNLVKITFNLDINEIKKLHLRTLIEYEKLKLIKDNLKLEKNYTELKQIN